MSGSTDDRLKGDVAPESMPSPTRATAAAILCLTAGVLPGFLTGALGGAIGDELGFGGAGLGVALASAYALAAVGSVLLHGGGGVAIWLEKALLVLFVMLTVPINFIPPAAASSGAIPR